MRDNSHAREQQELEGEQIMKTASEFFFEDIISKIYAPNKQRKALPYPEFVYEIKNDQEALKRSIECIQSITLMVLSHQEKFGNYFHNVQHVKSNSIGNAIDLLLGIIKLKLEIHEDGNALIHILENLKRNIGIDQNSIAELIDKSPQASFTSIHELLTEACERNASIVTPIDLSLLMSYLAIDKNSVDVYHENGLGLLSGNLSSNNKNVRLTSNLDFNKKTQPAIELFNELKYWYKNNTFINQILLQVDKTWSNDKTKSNTLLVNALEENLPFFPPTEDDSGANHEGALNYVLNGHYERVVVLVSNSILSTGRGAITADKTIDYCLKKGLKQVIQLPNGVVSNRNKEDSILVFDCKGPSSEVVFSEIPSNLVVDAQRGFGKPRRAQSFENQITKISLLMELSQKRRVTESELRLTMNGSRSVMSFQASRFIKEDPFKKLNNKVELSNLSNYFDLIRGQHLPQNYDDSIEYFEISTDNIDQYGNVTKGRKKITDKTYLENHSRQTLKVNDILLCYRGSADTIGTVGFIHDKSTELLHPNQSFYIVRAKSNIGQTQLTPYILFHWFRTEYCQNYFSNLSLSTNVFRLAPRDVEQIQIPIGPDNFLAMLIEKYQRWSDTEKDIQNLNNKLKLIESEIWSQL